MSCSHKPVGLAYSKANVEKGKMQKMRNQRRIKEK